MLKVNAEPDKELIQALGASDPSSSFRLCQRRMLRLSNGVEAVALSIAMVTSDRHPGGIQKAYENYAVALDRLGCSTHFVLPAQAPSVKALRSRFPLANIYPLGPIELMLMRRLGWVPPGLSEVLRRCQLVITHNNYLCRPLKTTRLPVVAVSNSDKLKGAEFADALICFSTRSAHAARLALPKVSVHLLPHYFECPQSENLFLKRENGPLVVSTAARLVARKGVEDFIQMAGRLKSVYPSALFLIAGAGEQETQLRQLNAQLGDPAKFIGWQSVSDLANRTDIYCLTSRVESFGYALCEMMAHGVPCVASACNGPLQIVGSSPAALMFEPGDVEALSSHVAGLMESQALRMKLSAAGHDRICSDEFSTARFDRRLQDVFNSLVVAD